jgi:putative NADH-flavin reductase
MDLVVFGANGPTGRLLTAQALAEGHAVTAVTRHPAGFPTGPDRLTVLGGDVLDPAMVERAVIGKDAVLSTLGVPYSRKPISVYSEGAANIVRAMDRHGVRRLVCVTSSATQPHPRPQAGFLFERVLQPFFIGVVGRTLYDDMRRLESLVAGCGLDWTIVRPSGLFETPAVTAYEVAQNHVDGRFTARADLADCVLRQLDTDSYVRKFLAVATTSVQPSLYQMIWREGIRKQRAPGAPSTG